MERYDVIICLGNVFTDEEAIKSMELRTAKAVELYNSGAAGHLLFTGGYKTRKDLSEAQFMADIARRAGMPKGALLLEESANSTIENARYSARIMHARHFTSAIVVTSPDHVRRSAYIFSRLLPGVRLSFVEAKSGLSLWRRCVRWHEERKALRMLKRHGLDPPRPVRS